MVHDDQLWFYYTGLKYCASFTYLGTFPNGKSVPMTGWDRDTGAVCLAVLRRDGFVSLDAADKEGRLVTLPFALPAGKLYANLDAQEGELHRRPCE